MEEEQIHTDPLYVRGFNNGYLIAKHEPELAAQLLANPNANNVYFNGLLGGKHQYEREVKEWAKGFSKGNPDKSKGIEKER